MRHYFSRHQASHNFQQTILAGIGGVLAIGLTGALSVYAGTPLLIASFGSSCVLLFSLANSPLSQPMNVVGGHLIATAIAIAMRMVLPNEWWAVALAVGVAISVMAALRLTHPPAGANPVVVFGADPGIEYLVTPILSGSISLVVIASLFHWAARTSYPLRKVD